MTTLSGWGTASHEDTLIDNSRDTLVDRARKRRVELGANVLGANVGYATQWLVHGEESLGDAYPAYKVDEWGGKYHCSCQDHTGGKYRKMCSHILGVVLWKRDHPEYQQSGQDCQTGEEGERGHPAHDEVMSAPRHDPSSPPIVEGEGAREASPPWADRPPSPPRPLDDLVDHLTLPSWVTELREHQVNAIHDVVEAFQKGAKVVFLDAPTGSGKTLIAECVRQMVNPTSKTIYTCSTKTLQDQFLEDFDHARVIKGRRNYPTELGGPETNCDDCTGHGPDDCRFCEVVCPYLAARGEAMSNSLAVLNTSYAMTMWNYTDGMFDKYPLVVVDECDLLEGAVMGHTEVRVGEGTIIRYGLGYPEKKTVVEAWVDWAMRVIVKLQGELPNIRGKDVRAIREWKRVKRLIGELQRLVRDLTNEDEDVTWVYMPESGSAVFRPVTVDHLGQEVLWSHGEQRWLVMSASIISPAEMADSLGLEDDWELVTVPSTFPIENRTIHVANIGSMARKSFEDTLPRMLDGLVKIVKAHEGERVLIHTVSYHLAKTISDYLTGHLHTRTVVRYTNSAGRDEALEEYLGSEGAVMVAPSMDRGVDLPGDACRVQVIAKVPFPNLGDKQVQSRLYGTRGGELWYAVQTVRSIVQMTGRAIRSSEDRATTYILDGSFVRLWKQWERLFPEWWREALDFSGTKKRELGL